MNRFFGPSKTWKSLFGTASSTRDDNAQLSAVFQKFKQDWDLAEYDESTELALLSILTGQIYEMYYSRRSYYAIKPAVAREIKIFLQQASLHAGRVESHSAHLIKTRPYLQWRILTETINRNLNCYVFQKDRDTEIETMPGNLYDEWPLPIYVPKSTERPHWPKPNPAFPPNESLLWVLKTCRDNGDYKTEASCLYELIARAENPRSYFEELDDLLLQKQGDYRAYLESCISQYHLSTEESSSRRLIQKLKEANVQLASSSEEELDTLRIAGLQIQNALCYQFPELWPDIKQNLKLIGKMVRPELKTNPLDIQGKTGEQVPEHDTGAQRDRDDPIIHKEPGSSGLSFKPKRNGGRSPARTRPNDKSRISKQRGYGEASTEIHKNNTRRRSPSPHSNIELLMSQRILERNDIRQDMDIWKQKQDIERLERKLDRLMGSLHNETTQGPQMEPNMTVAQDNPPGGSGEKNINIRKPDELLEEVGNAQVTEKNTQGLDDQTQIGKEHQPRVSSDQEEPLSTGNGEAENPYSGEEVE
ncbi:hypothetical protein N7478_001738 [Penicillium angulare]|uniref:uncharacterized protein n=1 Tax=Penicillium angulare TaxID=116970 RepID=UPI00253F8061|nr:uncharacterized protein N7478_001738 [Penicillium angulare]KAJ5288708.1 hypothetical protein N7478_001738 [Penicillium angulare]